MQPYSSFLDWLDHQKKHMQDTLKAWVNINSHALNYEGLKEQIEALKKAFIPLDGAMEELTLDPMPHIDEKGNLVKTPLGKALHITKRKNAPIQIFLGGHMDTVYPKNSPFQRIEEKENNVWVGPGIADMKGGLVIMLFALQALEKSPYANQIGWEVLINPDEEIGSPGAHSLLEACAKKNHLGLLFEPSHVDGALVSKRSGTMNLVVVVKGKAAHAGRDFHEGISALYAICPFLLELESLSEKEEDGVTVNVGQLNSGIGFNIVPDLAIAKINVRAPSLEKLNAVRNAIDALVKKYGKKAGITMTLEVLTIRPPKEFDEKTKNIFDWVQTCGNLLDIKIEHKPSRGGTDGSILHAAGLANIDALGVIGGKLHTHDEYINLESLVLRAKLTALLLMKIGNGEFDHRFTSPSIQL